MPESPDVDANEELIASHRLALHDKAEGTRRLYGQHLRYFVAWLAENDRTTDLLEVRRADIEAWFASAAHLSQATRRSRWISLRSFYGWCVEEEEIDVSPMARVKVARPNEAPPEVISPDALKRLLKACEGRDFYARRDMALLRLYLATGARLAELASLELADIDLQTRLVVITKAKGGKRRTARFDAGTASAVDRYKRARARHASAKLPWLWIGLKGRLTDSGIDNALRRRADQAGVEGFHVHSGPIAPLTCAQTRLPRKCAGVRYCVLRRWVTAVSFAALGGEVPRAGGAVREALTPPDRTSLTRNRKRGRPPAHMSRTRCQPSEGEPGEQPRHMPPPPRSKRKRRRADRELIAREHRVREW